MGFESVPEGLKRVAGGGPRGARGTPGFFATKPRCAPAGREKGLAPRPRSEPARWRPSKNRTLLPPRRGGNTSARPIRCLRSFLAVPPANLSGPSGIVCGLDDSDAGGIAAISRWLRSAATTPPGTRVPNPDAGGIAASSQPAGRWVQLITGESLRDAYWQEAHAASLRQHLLSRAAGCCWARSRASRRWIDRSRRSRAARRCSSPSRRCCARWHRAFCS